MDRILLFAFGALTLLPLSTTAQNEALWLRYPAISPDGSSIVFSYQGDLWRVDASGGTASLLTTNEAYEHSPVWSHDGKWIAFASDRHGNNDVFIMPSTGGPATRLTYNSANDVPSDLTPDNSAVLFSSNRLYSAADRQFPSGRFGDLYQVPVGGGEALRVMPTAAVNASYSPDGTTIVYQDIKGYENNFRKHHTSSVTRDIWTYDVKDKQYAQISTFNGEDLNPVFSPDGMQVYFLSEAKGSMNVFRTSIFGGPSTQITFLDKDPVRYLSISSNGTLCFAFRGALYTMAPGAAPQRITVSTATDSRYAAEKTIPVKGDASEITLSPNGNEVVFVHRGDVFVTSVKEGTTRRITDTPEQERSASFSPDGRSIIYASERSRNAAGGSWDLYRSSLTRKSEKQFFNATVLKEEAVLATPAEEFQPVFSPDGKEVAYLEERTTVKVVNLASGKTRTILPGDRNYSYSDGDQYFSWSPDSKWLLVEFLQGNQWITQCGLVSASGNSPVVNLTKSGHGGAHPKWALDGKAMLWFSGRDGMKNQASWGGQEDAYAMFFTQAALDTFKLNKEEYELLKKQGKGDEKGEDGEDGKDSKGGKGGKGGKGSKEVKKDSTVAPLKFELDGIENRKVRLTINSSDLADAVLSKDGEKLYYLASFEKGYDLWETNVRSKETKLLVKIGAEDAGSLEMDKEGKNLFFLNNGGISMVDLDKGEVKGVGINGEMTLNAAAERDHLFGHVWRQVVKKFYVKDLQGTDWEYYKKEYAQYLPYINNDNDFAELLSEMLGELNASHTGAYYRDRDPQGDATAHLGLFYTNDTMPGLTIAEVMERSPVIKAGSKIKAGMVIEKIDGIAISSKEDPARLLDRKAGRNTLLSLFDPKTGKRWEETVKPIDEGEENELLYHRWVERNRHAVDSISGGRVGYVHVRGMNNDSYKTVYEEVLGKYYGKDALVVDTRFNGGGWLHDDLATFLNGHVYMHLQPRGQDLGTEPQFKWTKPSVVLMNESNYSDAHMFPFTYKALGIGKLVGMPVPGTGTAVWWEDLQNGVIFGIPQVGMVDNNGNYLENQQLEPDVKQAAEPGLLSTGTDQQIGAAVKVLLEGKK
ncbi:MAG: PD40 domain-containing protein [Flavobacteriales bacterium]|nr:PD40 domain-containing protein [Flavobacteriales bacterium]